MGWQKFLEYVVACLRHNKYMSNISQTDKNNWENNLFVKIVKLIMKTSVRLLEYAVTYLRYDEYKKKISLREKPQLFTKQQISENWKTFQRFLEYLVAYLRHNDSMSEISWAEPEITGKINNLRKLKNTLWKFSYGLATIFGIAVTYVGYDELMRKISLTDNQRIRSRLFFPNPGFQDYLQIISGSRDGTGIVDK